MKSMMNYTMACRYSGLRSSCPALTTAIRAIAAILSQVLRKVAVAISFDHYSDR